MDEDNLLIDKYLDGDEISLKVLIDKYTSSIYNFTQRFTGPLYAPDVTQEVFIKVWKNLKNFDKNKSQFKTWLFTIARNSVTDYLRKKKSTPFSFLNDNNFIEDNVKDEAKLPDEILENLQDKEMLIKILDELPPNYKLILTLYYQEDMTFKEIGVILNKPLNTVKSYHLRAIKKLKQNFAPKSNITRIH